MSQKIAMVGMLIGVSLLGCGKSVNQGERIPGTLPDSATPPPDIHPILKACTDAERTHWTFTQPDPVESRKVDLLFVVDASSSLAKERAQIAASIPSFIAKLNPGTDLRIGVMLGHGGASKHSGRLYSNTGAPAVIDGSALTPAEVQVLLTINLKKVTKDSDQANGETLMYSLLKSLEPARVAEIQAQGFYRPDAALSVVFVTDENDVCYSPVAHGYLHFPDYKPSAGLLEEAAFAKYCKFPTGFAEYHDWVDHELRLFKGDKPVTLGAITHVDPKLVPYTESSEDAIGHGIIELVRTATNGVLMDIADSSYDSGLEKLGDVISQWQQNILTRFKLRIDQPIREDSLRVMVDTAKVKPIYHAPETTVELLLQDAGQSHSVIDVSACFGAS